MSKKKNDDFIDFLEQMASSNPTKTEVSAITDQIRKELAEEKARKAKEYLTKKFMQIQGYVSSIREMRRNAEKQIQIYKDAIENVKKQAQHYIETGEEA